MGPKNKCVHANVSKHHYLLCFERPPLTKHHYLLHFRHVGHLEKASISDPEITKNRWKQRDSKKRQKAVNICPNNFFLRFLFPNWVPGGGPRSHFFDVFFSALDHLGAQRPQGAAPRAHRPQFLLIFYSFGDRF